MIYQTDDENEFLYCGNVGINIYEKYRYKGYSNKAFKLLIEPLKELGFDKVYITCKTDNTPSYRSIENLGAKFIDERTVPEDSFSWLLPHLSSHPTPFLRTPQTPELSLSFALGLRQIPKLYPPWI